MLQITSNIEQVIAEFKAAEEYLQTQAMPAVMQAEDYLPDLRQATRVVLAGYFTGPEADNIPALTDAIVGWAKANLMGFELTASLTFTAFESLQQLQPGDVGFDKLAPLQGAIEDWVQQYKDLTRADVEKYPSTTQLARHLMGTLQNDPQKWVHHLAVIREKPGLLQYLAQADPAGFAAAFGLVGIGMPAGRLAEALDAVLAFWEEKLGVTIVAKSMAEIDKAFAL